MLWCLILSTKYVLQLLDKGLNQLTWRSKDLNDFIEAASQLICTDVHVNLDIVQSNSREITEAALGWCKGTTTSILLYCCYSAGT